MRLTLTTAGARVWATHQGEVVRVDPDDAQVWVVSVVPGHLLQGLQELIAICSRIKKVSNPRAYMALSTDGRGCGFSMRVS